MDEENNFLKEQEETVAAENPCSGFCLLAAGLGRLCLFPRELCFSGPGKGRCHSLRCGRGVPVQGKVPGCCEKACG